MIQQCTANITNGEVSPAYTSKRKRPTKRIRSDTAAAIAIIASAQLEPDLLLLGPQAQDFFLSQGITTVKALLSLSTKETVTALAKDTECGFATALRKVERWRKETRQRQKTRKEQPVGLHPAFEVFIIDERSFFAAVLITTPNDLLQYKNLSLAYMDWRHKNN